MLECSNERRRPLPLLMHHPVRFSSKSDHATGTANPNGTQSAAHISRLDRPCFFERCSEGKNRIVAFQSHKSRLPTVFALEQNHGVLPTVRESSRVRVCEKRDFDCS